MHKSYPVNSCTCMHCTVHVVSCCSPLACVMHTHLLYTCVWDMQHVGATVCTYVHTCVCVVVLSRQYSILTSTVHTVHVMYIVLSHSNKYNIIE